MSASLVFTIMSDGVAVPIATGASVSVQFWTPDAKTSLTAPRTVANNEGAANWAAGVVGIVLQPQEISVLTPPSAVVAISGPGFVKRFEFDIETQDQADRSLLFVKDLIITELRNDQLLLMSQTFFPGIILSDDFLWNKVVAAETEIGHDLRVPLVPTQYLPYDPFDPENAITYGNVVNIPNNLNQIPWAIDPPQDYEPDFFQGEKWGFLVLRYKPVIKVQQVVFVYPAPTTGFFQFPNDWIRLDNRYGQMRFVPASHTFEAPLNAFLLQALGGGRTIPFAFAVSYIAGLKNARKDYPELIDAIKKRAVLKIIEDGFIPSSGSISADGLSQSMGVNMELYRDSVNSILYGPKGSNGGLMTAIHGIRSTILGN